jgi:hypothetical protein
MIGARWVIEAIGSTSAFAGQFLAMQKKQRFFLHCSESMLIQMAASISEDWH